MGIKKKVIGIVKKKTFSESAYKVFIGISWLVLLGVSRNAGSIGLQFSFPTLWFLDAIALVVSGFQFLQSVACNARIGHGIAVAAMMSARDFHSNLQRGLGRLDIKLNEILIAERCFDSSSSEFVY